MRIVRILDSANTLLSGPFLQFPIPVDFIDEFCIDPRADSAIEANISGQLTSLGVPNIKITKSQLYQFNANKLEFL